MTKDKKPCEYWPLAPKTGYYNIGGKRVWLEAEDPFPEIAPRTWVGLTDREKSNLWLESRAAVPRFYTYASLVEAKLKEKNT